jgi:hypothetical protein
MTKNIIELNGNTYDIRTGKIIDSAQTKAPAENKQDQNRSDGQSIDGYRKPAKKNRSESHSTDNSIKKLPRKSQTLMRNSVAKPNTNATSKTQDNQPTPELQKKSLTNLSRLERASKAIKSASVQKFSPNNNQASNHQPPTNTKNDQATTSQAPNSGPQQQHGSPSQPRSLADQAVDNATSHEQTFDEPSQSRMSRLWDKLVNAPTAVRYSLASLLMVGGLATIGYMSLPYLSVQIASSQSDIAASLPEYKPSGFQLNKDVEYSPNHIALQYDSVSDNRTFRINKEKTDWTSESLRHSFVETKGLYQAVPSNGKTIYIYNESNATWVDGGVWYNIEGSSSLNSDQLLRLANSL